MSLVEWQTQLSQVLLLPKNLPADALSVGAPFSALHGVDDQRLALYEELMFNTVRETLESIYPYTHQCDTQDEDHELALDRAAWPELVESYRRAYPNPSHRLMGAVENFPRFLAEQAEWMARYPFLSELALYEWLEMVVLNVPAEQPVMTVTVSQALPALLAFDQAAPVWNAARVLQQFEYPIPQVIEGLQSEEQPVAPIVPQPTEVLILQDI